MTHSVERAIFFVEIILGLFSGRCFFGSGSLFSSSGFVKINCGLVEISSGVVEFFNSVAHSATIFESGFNLTGYMNTSKVENDTGNNVSGYTNTFVFLLYERSRRG